MWGFYCYKMTANLVLKELYCSSFCIAGDDAGLSQNLNSVAAFSLLKPSHREWRRGFNYYKMHSSNYYLNMAIIFLQESEKSVLMLTEREREKSSHCLEGANGELCPGSYGINGEENNPRNIRLGVPFSCSQDI